jgi:multicomponent Na+:H+ antiporter subunit B
MLKDFIVIKLVLSFIIPYITLYAIYIQLNGEVSPGGGFQAGVIFATAIIGYELVFGKEQFLKFISIKTLVICSTLGVFLYASTGIISLIFNDNYLNYNSLGSSKITGQHLGIFLIELGVGLTVSSVMCLIYSLLRED